MVKTIPSFERSKINQDFVSSKIVQKNLLNLKIFFGIKYTKFLTVRN